MTDPGLVEVDCPECDGRGWTTESEHAYDSDCAAHNPRGSCSGCPVPVQAMCDNCRATGRIELGEADATE